MLSIGAMGNGQGTYYVGLAREDYYLEGGEPPGRWVGQGCAALGLEGEVSRGEFLNLFAGCDRDGLPLVQNAGAASRQPGWDLTFSAPKSVSLLWATTDAETRRAIQEAHFRAVKSALVTGEDGATTRRGHGGYIKQSAKLVIATFEHGTSRAQDPQLHTHALVLNVAVREDGTTGTIESLSFYDSKRTIGALYRAELSKQLQELGFGIERDGSSFRIAGSPIALEEEFSKRRAEIEARLGESGRDGARAAAFAALDTRRVKEHVAREELFAGWSDVGRRFGFDLADAQRLKGDPFVLNARKREKTLKLIVEAGIEELTHHQSYFKEADLVRVVAEDAQGRGIGADDVRFAVAKDIKENLEIMEIGMHKGEVRYTTRELWNIEEAMLKGAERLKATACHRCDQDALAKGLRQTETKATAQARKIDPQAPAKELNEEQRTALSYLARDSGSVALLSGMAGTGKTFLLDAAREVWQEQGFKVIGAAAAGKAARGLEDGAGIKSATLARLALEWERGFDSVEVSEAFALKVQRLYEDGRIDDETRRQLLQPLRVPHRSSGLAWHFATWKMSASQKELLEKHVERRERFELDAKTVLVVDEAGMVGTRQMAKLVERAERSGAKLVLVGDARQLQPIDAGGPFQSLENRQRGAVLKGIVRQKEEWARQAVLDFAEGDAHLALQAFEARGLLRVASNRDEAKAELILGWSREGIESPEENVIFAVTRAEVKELNRLAQEARRNARKLGLRSAQVGGTRIYVKDRVVFTKNSASLGVQNGSTGQVRAIDTFARTMKIRLDDGGQTVSVPYAGYEDMELGYALTTYKGQGVTTTNAFVLCGGATVNREITYVQASRAKDRTEFFTERILEFNPHTQQREEATMQTLVDNMSKTDQKDLAHDVGHGVERTAAHLKSDLVLDRHSTMQEIEM